MNKQQGVVVASRAKVSGRSTLNPKNLPNGVVQVTYDQIFTQIIGDTNEGTQFREFPLFINQAELFPWISRYSELYNRYKVSKLEFEYITSQSVNVAGQVYMGFSQDPEEDIPTTVQQMSSLQAYVQGPLWHNFSMRSKPANEWLYTQFFNSPRFASFGKLIIALDNVAGNATYGTIRVKMTVDFKDSSNVTTPTYFAVTEFDGITRGVIYNQQLKGDRFVYIPQGSTRVAFRQLGYYTVMLGINTTSAVQAVPTFVENTDYKGIDPNSIVVASALGSTLGWIRVKLRVTSLDNNFDVGKIATNPTATITGHISYIYRGKNVV